MLNSSISNEKLTQLSNNLKDEIVCPICLRCLHRCVTLVPCLHNFCGSCISQCLIPSSPCPVCREPVANFRKNAVLDLIIKDIEVDPNLKRTPQECEELDRIDNFLKDLSFIRYANGGTYEGYCQDNKRQGKGKYIASNGETYEGEWVNDQMEGYGVYTFPDGQKYEGFLKNGAWEGSGTYIWPSGESHIGMYKEGRAEGPGVHISPDGTVFRGEYKNDERNGEGRLEAKDGVVYESTWENGEMAGKGVIRYVDGSVYEGDWGEDYKRKGRGLMKWVNGDRYEGDWKNDKKDGQGVIIWANGDRYEGGWKDDKKEGKGKMVLSDDEVIYEGRWRNNWIYTSSWKKNANENGNGVKKNKGDLDNGKKNSCIVID